VRRALLLPAVVLAGCGASKPPARPEPRATAVPTPVPRLAGSTLEVPLDRSRRGGETLKLKVRLRA